jgi:hypothetical protein
MVRGSYGGYICIVVAFWLELSFEKTIVSKLKVKVENGWDG